MRECSEDQPAELEDDDSSGDGSPRAAHGYQRQWNVNDEEAFWAPTPDCAIPSIEKWQAETYNDELDPSASSATVRGDVADDEAISYLENLVDDSEQASPDDFLETTLSPPLNSSSKGRLRVELPTSTLLLPRSCYEPFEPTAPFHSERQATKILTAAFQSIHGDSSGNDTIFQLNDFAVYFEHKDYPQEMRSLHQLHTKAGYSDCFFDGVLSVGETRVFVRRVRITALPIGNYGTLNTHTVRRHIWVQSAFNNSGRNVFYQLCEPAVEYARFFKPFLWVADLAKHFVDFLKTMAGKRRKVAIHHFKSSFSAFMSKVHGNSPMFLHWHSQHRGQDFRTSIVANIAFLHKEARGVLSDKDFYFHAIWSEILQRNHYPKHQPLDSVGIPRTIVTQYMHECFRDLPFGDQLKAMKLSKNTETLRDRVIERHGMEPSSLLDDANTTKDLSCASQKHIMYIQPGDTISTQRDAAESGSQWKREISKEFDDVDRWFALVQRVNVNGRGVKEFDVIWYYRPVDTLCGLMKYPWKNELFLSDHCSCLEKHKISADEVLGVHEVDFGGNSTTTSELFCRQLYIYGQRKWVTLQTAHKRCQHNRIREDRPKYSRGNTHLVHIDTNSAVSEPCEVVESFRKHGRLIYRFRRLLRREKVEPGVSSRPNELVYTDQYVEVREQRILGDCHVRVFRPGIKVPTPYDRDGVGNFFYMTHKMVNYDGVDTCVPLEGVPSSLQQGYDPDEEIPRLQGLDLFCGGGNFGRGLEDGAGIEMKWANDYDSTAMHTYMANLQDPASVNPFLGSIDDLQRLAIQGKFSKQVPHIGDVDFISGGSPCPGFSALTNDKTTAAQRKNQSLVAAFGSFIDLYRPKYGLLENVTGIVHKRKNRDQDVFSQLICAIVGLGYQTQFFFLDASSCGSPQRRTRVFLVFAAPGLALPRRPQPSHSHPPNTKELGLGLLPTGEHMAEREMPIATPFKFVSAAEATADLPRIFDSKLDICVAYPDHRSPFGVTPMSRERLRLVPTRPWGSNFASAWFGTSSIKAHRLPGSGVMTAVERLSFPPAKMTSMSNVAENSKAFGRVFPNHLFTTITTSQQPSDAKNGRLLHWSEDRTLTVMEARRAQGFRDEDVLLGDPRGQYKIVGNSVARQVAVALGAVFREAWESTLRSDTDNDIEVEEVEMFPDLVAQEVSRSSADTSFGRRMEDILTPATSFSPSPTRRTWKKRVAPHSSIAVELFTSKIRKKVMESSPRSAMLDARELVGTTVTQDSSGRTVIVIED